MNGSWLGLAQKQQSLEAFDFQRIVELLGHSLAIGAILMALAVWTMLVMRVRPKGMENSSLPEMLQHALVQASNVLFLCLGVTAVMILVNNDLARAFAIGAAIALVRFRVKMNEGVSAPMLFAAVIGMACGVNEPRIAWGVGGIFILVQSILLVVVSLLNGVTRARRAQTAPAQPAQPQQAHAP